MITHRDYLMWTAAHTASALTEAIRTAIDMEDDYYAERYLANKIAVGRELLRTKGYNPDRVAPPTAQPDNEERTP